MQRNKLLIAAVFLTLFIIGSGVIIYGGRLVMDLPQSSTGSGDVSAGTYTMTDVQMHNREGSCWSVIKDNVYDLTSWISRHPGGPEAILGLCGTDGTAAYTNQHGDQGRPASMLALLKIGSLK